MRRSLIIILALFLVMMLLLIIPFAHSEEFIFDSSLYNANSITTNVIITNDITVDGVADELTARLFYFPKRSLSSKILSEGAGGGTIGSDNILYEWSNVSGTVTLYYTANITSEVFFPKIHKKVPFPYDYLPQDLIPYIQSKEIIQVTLQIRSLTEEVIGPETDAVRAVFKIGKWVKDNIRYDLNTVTAKASKSSTWVLANRQGVCDELTSLFIAMVRSQGIPARFVSGVAYTNLASLDTNWGPHGWAEVWYPGVGWVPYDVTYGEFGYVDATHTPYEYSEDARSDAVSYTMRSFGADMIVGDFLRNTTLIDYDPGFSHDPLIDVSVALGAVGPDSYNRIDATITNPYDYYIGFDVFLARTQGISVDDTSKSVLLGPYESTTIHWYGLVDEDINPGFIYTFPVYVYTPSNYNVNTSFIVSSKFLVANKPDLIIPDVGSDDLLPGTWSCDYENEVFTGVNFTVLCSFSNKATVCINDACANNSVSESLVFDDVGVYTVVAVADDGSLKSRHALTITAVDKADIDIDLAAPDSAGDTFNMTIVLSKNSFTTPKDITVELSHPLINKKWLIGSLDDNATISVSVNPVSLFGGSNTFNISVEFFDGVAKKRLTGEKTIIIYSDNLFYKLVLWINKLRNYF